MQWKPREFLDKMGAVLATENVGFGTGGNRDLVYENILEERASWQDHVCPVLLPALLQHPKEWMEDAKRIAVAG
jgi:hypothetical protein